MPRITISYRRDDSLDITGRIFDRLAAHFGREAVFRDIDNIPPGVDFRRHIDLVLDDSDVVLAIVGPKWTGPAQHRLASPADPVRVEIETALRKNKPLIPVLVSAAAMPLPDELPDSLCDFAYRNAVRVDSGQDFDVHLGRLIHAVERFFRIKEGRAADEAVRSAVAATEPAPTFALAQNREPFLVAPRGKRARPIKGRTLRLAIIAGTIAIIGITGAIGRWVSVERQAEIAQQERATADRAQTEAQAYNDAAANGDLAGLNAYVNTCQLCVHKVQAQAIIPQLEAKQRDVKIEESKKDLQVYTAAKGDPAALHAYLNTCLLCTYKAQAQADIQQLEAQEKTHTRTLVGKHSLLASVAFSPDGRELAVADYNEVKLWEFASGRLMQTLFWYKPEHELDELGRNVRTVAFSPDGRTLAAAGEYFPMIKLWDATNGGLLETLSNQSGSKPAWAYHVLSLAFSPDGRTLASGGAEDGAINLWERDGASWRGPHTLSGHTGRVSSVAFSPDGGTLASASHDKTIKLWSTARSQLLRTLTGHTDFVNSIVFSPAGDMLASGGYDTKVVLWDTTSGRLLRTLIGHIGSVNSVAFSLDGRILASGSDDKTVKLWDVATGRILQTLTGHTASVNSVAFSPDGRTLASAGDDGTIRLWDMSDPSHTGR